ncbi:leucine-rich repeat receptor protein kinase HPCA1-like [Amaranthus tricolor]|uniref:leucine-rich repeat receptor protein kinase HPCA1-like n=1 Tax=Amaranthus tricolor TaxID=29722 RepID=UPI00258529FB|nr:leucine-rich repeat receptor protein kinase HPCA1-like [Amaranthus tricolor]XP_057541932.1 leucine-rich repeat receptor protein kinase HPCA1-like [Amaranthus tricolor]
MLASMRLEGTLSSDIQELSELRILDLSYNKGLTGSLPSAIGKLSKLTNLVLVGCSFNGPIPDTIGSLSQLRFLYLNSNSFSGSIPNTIGNLLKLFWLDLGENKLTGTIPISNGTTPGLDMLINTKHFHLGRNQLSGSIPPQLLHENLTMLHLLLDNNKLTGDIPPTLGFVQTLEAVRLDFNAIGGPVPSNINNLTNVKDMLLSNNQLTGPMPDLTGMTRLGYLDMSNNSFDATDFPSWLIALPSLTDLMMERTTIEGEVPETFFSLPHLHQVLMKSNNLNGKLDIGDAHSSELRIINLQNNNISAYTHRSGDRQLQLNLIENPVCNDDTDRVQSYCGRLQQTNPSYVTPRNCIPTACSSNKFSSQNCQCAYPYTGNFVFRAPYFSNLQNFTYYTALELKLMTTFLAFRLPVDSVSLSNISRNPSNYLGITLQIFPLAQDRFNRTAISILGFMMSNQTFKAPPFYGTFYFIADEYTMFADEPGSGEKKTLGTAAIIGIAVGISAFVLVSLCVGVFFFCYRRKPAKPVEPNYPSGLGSGSPWTLPGSNSSALQLPGSRLFSLEEVKKLTNNFSEASAIGSGGFGKVYKGALANGLLVAVKRANHESKHGSFQFKAEIELLTRVHHKNLVRLLGFCLERELILIYEYVPNGTLKESLSGTSGIRLDWKRRIQVALDAARGLAYLHELASQPFVHRDIKSTNILLDENLNAKVSDFGLSKPMNDGGRGYITTEVKGTMGYLDPEYYRTYKLNEKSDVYSFGVVMLELATGRSALDRERYVVSEVQKAVDRTQDLYGLHEVLDPSIGLGTSLKGIEKYIDLALRCVEELGVNRPPMGEVVKQLEDIYERVGLNPYSDSGGSSTAFDLYGVESFYLRDGALPR